MSTVRESVIRIVANAFPSILHAYARTYIVAAVRADKTLDLVPPIDAPQLRELEAVEQWALAGTLATPVVGASVGVVFRDANKRRPVALLFGPGIPAALSIDAGDALSLGPTAHTVDIAGGGPAVARVGDTIVAGYLLFDAGAIPLPTLYYSPAVTPTVYGIAIAATGLVVVGVLSNPASPAPPSPGTPGTPITGRITSGSSIATCG